MSKQYGAQRLLNEFLDKGWKLESIDSLLKRIRKTLSSGKHAAADRVRGPCAQSGGQAKKAPISSRNIT